MKKQIVLVVCILFVLSACAPSASAVQTAIAQTKAALPLPTFTPLPTYTPRPTYTPYSTATTRPTSTPTVTTYKVMAYQGNGDQVIDLPTDTYGVLQITGNSGSHYFGVEGFDANNNSVDLLVNTTDSYDGRIAVNLFGDKIARLQVSATGDWTVKYIPLGAYDHKYTKNEILFPLIGKGDDIWLFTIKVMPKTIIIKGNASNSYFGVKFYGLNDYDLAVNTTEKYNGIYLYPASLGYLVAIVITASDDWNIIIQQNIP